MSTTVFETEPCTRCGGTGCHSFNGEHDRCYKCNGENGCRALTKRGKAAKEYYLSKFKVPASEVKVGQAIRTDRIKKLTAIEVKTVPSGARYMKDGIWHDVGDQVRITGAKTAIQVAPDTLVRILPTAEENENAIADALAYQATLTKAGTPRKGTK
jgi:hypothetical protein